MLQSPGQRIDRAGKQMDREPAVDGKEVAHGLAMQVDSARFRSFAPTGQGHLPAPCTSARALRPIAVTGTNGKTTTTAWIAAALTASRTTPVMRTSTVGYFLDDEPLGLPPDYESFLAMVGYASVRGARDVVLELTSNALLHGYGAAFPASIAVFTNLSHDHLDKHRTPEAYLHAKSLLFAQMSPTGTAVLNARDAACRLLARHIPLGVRVLSYGVPTRGRTWCAPDLDAYEVRTSWAGTEVLCVAKPPFTQRSFMLRTSAIGDVFAENAMAALTAAIAAGIDLDVALRAIAAAPPPHTPDALERTIAAARRLAKGKITVVFGAAGERDAEKREPMGVAATAADRVILTSDNPRRESPREIADGVARGLVGMRDVTIELDRRRAIELAVTAAEPQDVVLVCGKGHEEVQILGTRRVAFSDAEVVRSAVRGRS
jgi:UDP-N-acetylmuramoyl-L-alanyl-D-glutamate--2,6-diaminopimelate ligase